MWIRVLLSTLLKSYPHTKNKILRLIAIFFKLTTETTASTTTISISYKKKLRIENIFNTSYQVINKFGTSPRAFYLRIDNEF